MRLASLFSKQIPGMVLINRIFTGVRTIAALDDRYGAWL